MSAFWIGRFEVTQAWYDELMSDDPSFFKGADLPVDSLSWEEAKLFCKRFSEKYGVDCRLPTEAEWEYACRSGTTTTYYWGENIDDNTCWYYENSEESTHPIGMKTANGWGIHDMIGNVWEWCEDWYSEKYYLESRTKDPAGPKTSTMKVIRGGSWNDGFVIHLRSSYRYCKPPRTKDDIIGFRLVLSAE